MKCMCMLSFSCNNVKDCLQNKEEPLINAIDFGEIPNFSRLAEQAGKLTYMILYVRMKIQQYVFLILHQSVIEFSMKIQLTVYLLFDLPACSANLLNF